MLAHMKELPHKDGGKPATACLSDPLLSPSCEHYSHLLGDKMYTNFSCNMLKEG